MKFINSHQHIHLFIPTEVMGELGVKSIRSLSSAKFSLRKKPIRRFVFDALYRIFKNGKPYKNYKSYEYIIHPGTSYDY